MSDNYGFLAPFYQLLSRAVFGKKILEANRTFISDNLSKKLIIIGGGDGVAYQKYEKQLDGFYFEKSDKMLQLAQKNLRNSRLKFVHSEFRGQEKGDCFFLPFLLDSLTDKEISALLELIKNSLSPGGKVMVSDFFEPNTRIQKILLQTMLWFFQLLTGHQRKDLPDYPSFFQKSGFKRVKEKTWDRGWIRAQVYELDSAD